ncbi:unnamed protein product [Arabidopsis lyrata]|nr:unnamed protein product [Arabidopsis lyrata]
MDEASISISIMQELAKYENAEREVQRLQWIIMENESNDEKEILKSHFEVVKTFVREMLQASDKERALEVVKKVRRTSDQGVQKFKLEVTKLEKQKKRQQEKEKQEQKKQQPQKKKKR